MRPIAKKVLNFFGVPTMNIEFESRIGGVGGELEALHLCMYLLNLGFKVPNSTTWVSSKIAYIAIGEPWLGGRGMDRPDHIIEVKKMREFKRQT
jgi:hypothetical protein